MCGVVPQGSRSKARKGTPLREQTLLRRKEWRRAGPESLGKDALAWRGWLCVVKVRGCTGRSEVCKRWRRACDGDHAFSRSNGRTWARGRADRKEQRGLCIRSQVYRSQEHSLSLHSQRLSCNSRTSSFLVESATQAVSVVSRRAISRSRHSPLLSTKRFGNTYPPSRLSSH